MVAAVVFCLPPSWLLLFAVCVVFVCVEKTEPLQKVAAREENYHSTLPVQFSAVCVYYGITVW